MLTLKEIRDKYQTPRYDAKKMNHWATRKIYSRLATPIVWLLLPTRITANQITAGWVVLGVVSCLLFAVGKYWTTVLAALLMQLHVTLDYVDGPIARYRNSMDEGAKGNANRGAYIERVGHDLIYTIYFYCISIGAIKKGLEPLFILSFGFLASIGYFFYKYTRRARIFCALVYNADRAEKDIPALNATEVIKDKTGRKSPLKVLYRKTQSIWDPISFTIITLVAAFFDLVYILPIFYGLTYPVHFVISYIYQARIKDDWVYEWIKKVK